MNPAHYKVGVRRGQNPLDRKTGGRWRGSVGGLEGTRIGGLRRCAVVSNTTNTPVFFMLPPGRTPLPIPPSVQSRKGNQRVQEVKVTRVMGISG